MEALRHQIQQSDPENGCSQREHRRRGQDMEAKAGRSKLPGNDGLAKVYRPRTERHEGGVSCVV